VLLSAYLESEGALERGLDPVLQQGGPLVKVDNLFAERGNGLAPHRLAVPSHLAAIQRIEQGQGPQE
jgi:hypothetical protein